MTAKKSRGSTADQAQEALNHSRDLLIALSRAAQSVQKARTRDEIFSVVGEQIKALGFQAAILTLDGNREYLSYDYTTTSEKIIRLAEKISGLSAQGYRWPIPLNSTYSQVIDKGKAEFIPQSDKLFKESLPKPLRALTGQLMQMLKVEQGILAPLHVDEEVLGILAIFGNPKLSEADLPAMDSFAGQVAVSLRNAQLARQMQDELYARKLAEEALERSRNLLLALSRAAQSVQRARTEDEIYQAVGEQIKALGHEVIILTVSDEKQYLNYTYSTFSKRLIKAGEKLTGLSIQNFRFLIPPDSIYGRMLQTREGGFDNWTVDAIAAAIPKSKRSLAGQLARLLKIEHSVIALLQLENEVFGTLTVAGSSVTADDIPAIESFAAQVAISLNNARLARQAEQELSERKQVEDKLLVSQSTYEGIFNGITEAIYILDEDAVFLNVNLGAMKMYGYSPEYFIGRTPEFISAPGKNDHLQVLEYIRQAYRGKTVEFEFWGLRKDGSIFPKDVRLTPGIYFGKKVVIAVGRDITERKRAEEAVRRTEMHFKALIEKAPDGIALIGLDGKTNYASPSARDLFNHDIEGDVNANPLGFVHPDDSAIVLNAINELIQNPAFVPTLQYRYKHKDGTYHWVESTFSNLLAEPSVQAVVINFRDVTKRRRAEDALAESEAQYRMLADHMTDTVWLMDMDLKLVYISPSIQRHRGYSLQELQQLPIEQNFAPESIQALRDFLAVDLPKIMADPLLATSQFTRELRLYRKDGTAYWSEHKINTILDEQGRPISILGVGRDVTERKRMEKALYESERYYRALIENATDGIIVVKMDGKIRYESPAVSRLLGYDPDALIGTNAFEIINPDDLAQMADAFAEGLKLPGSIHRGEYRLRHRNGTWRHFEIVTHYLMNDPVIAGIIINGRDITERKLIEDALRESESKFHSVVSESADGIVLSDESGHIIEFNHAIEQITGLKREEALGRFLWDLQFQIMPKQAQTDENYVQVKNGIQKALETGQSPFLYKIVEAPFEHPSGSMRFIQQHVFSMRTQKGWRMGSISRDITERRQVEQALRVSEDRYRVLYEDNPSMYFTADADGTILSVNKFGVECLGYELEHLVGQPIVSIFHPEDRAIAQQQLEFCVRNPEQTIQIDARKMHKNGTVLWVRESACAIRDVNNQVVVLLICDDITERKRAEDALAASEAELRALFASMQDAVLVIDRDGIYRKIAPTNPEKSYIAPQELLGKNLRDVFPAKKTETFLGAIQYVLEKQETLHIEYELSIDGQVPWFEASISPMGSDYTLWVARDISERKQAESKLHLQSAALEAAANAIIITDRNGLIQWANTSMTSLTGFDPGEVVGKNPRELVKSGRQGQEFYKELWDTILDGRTWHNELYNRRKDGAIYIEEMTITPLRNLEGEISHFIAVKQDITERKQAEAALIQSERAYRTLFENMPIGLYRTAVNGQMLDANPALVHMFGYPDQASLLDAKAEDLYVDPIYNKRFKEEIDSKGILSGFEAQFRRLDNTTFWAEDYVRTIYDEEGKPLLFEGSLIDITERKQAEDELRRASRSLEIAHRDLQQMFAHEQVLARTDGLTGLHNRRYFFELAAREFSASVRYRRPLTIILFDVDGFKLANDTFGHAMGDTILAQIAETASAQVRTVDVLARYGGDEFIILLPQTKAPQAFVIAERIRNGVAQTRLAVDNSPFVVTLSIGIAEASHDPEDVSVEDAIRRADQALYMAKANGNNQTVIYRSKG